MHSRQIRLVMFLGRPVLYVFFGKDSFSLHERLDELRASLDADGMLASSTTVLDGRKISLVEVRAACDTVPFMSANRLVIVEGLLSRLAGAAAGSREPSGHEVPLVSPSAPNAGYPMGYHNVGGALK